MIPVLAILVIFFMTLSFYELLKRNKPDEDAPPGPKGIPLLGNILQFGTDPLNTLSKWSREYGSMVNVNICGQKFLFLNDAKCIREMFNEIAFIGKPDHVILTAFSKGPWGIISTEGDVWEAHRRFTLRGLRDFGFSKHSMEGLIMDEITEAIDLFKGYDGKAFPIGNKFNISVSNSLWTIVNGERSKHDDSNSSIYDILHNLIRTINMLFQSGIFVFPWLRHIIPEWSGYTEFSNNIDGLQDFVLKAVDVHVKNFTANSPRDFIDLYLEEINNAKPESAFYREVGERHMIATIVDLFLAGNETTAVTLSWAMLYLCRHPSIQDTLHQEIDMVVGKKRQPFLSDRPSMPYCEAVMMEVLRKSSLIPFGVPHQAIRDEEFRGYLIPRDTIIIAHLDHVMNNPDVWGDPENFRPERFLNEDRTKVLKNENLIPFQAGKRQCLGEGLAKDTLFLFLASIFQQFEILPDPDNPKPSLSPLLGFVNSPSPYQVCLKLRNKNNNY